MKNRSEDFPFVSVILTNLNGKGWLVKGVPSILASDYPAYEVIVVDNGSTDGSVEYLQANYPSVKVIPLPRNIGWSPANNQGIRVARGSVIVCISNDMTVDPDWLKEIVTLIISDSKIGIVQCNSLSMWDRSTPDSSMNYLDEFGYSYGYRPQASPREVFFAEGMAFAFKKELVHKIGMLDDYYFMEYDDMDFSWRARLAGYSVYFLPSAVVYHARGATVGRTYFDRTRNVTLYTRNHLVTLIKNYEAKSLMKALPLTILIEAAKILYLLLTGNTTLAIAASEGLIAIVKDRRLLLAKRRETQRIRKIPDSSVMRLMNRFDPRVQLLFLRRQANARRLILNCDPRIRGR
jgi:hypothetical protein